MSNPPAPLLLIFNEQLPSWMEYQVKLNVKYSAYNVCFALYFNF